MLGTWGTNVTAWDQLHVRHGGGKSGGLADTLSGMAQHTQGREHLLCGAATTSLLVKPLPSSLERPFPR